MADNWYCGEIRAQARIVGNRVAGYEYRQISGCGYSNSPNSKQCENCGRARREKA
jgi:hypothetical protein